jgi:hypothetical protein
MAYIARDPAIPRIKCERPGCKSDAVWFWRYNETVSVSDAINCACQKHCSIRHQEDWKLSGATSLSMEEFLVYQVLES